jgi:hypothetical protein
MKVKVKKNEKLIHSLKRFMYMVYLKPISMLIFFIIYSFFSLIIRGPIFFVFINAGINPYVTFIFTLFSTWPILTYSLNMFIQMYNIYILKDNVKFNYFFSCIDQYITANKASYLILFNMFITVIDLNIFNLFYNKLLDMQPEFNWTISILKEELLKLFNFQLFVITSTLIIKYLNNIPLEYFFYYIKQVPNMMVKPLKASILPIGIPLVLYDSMGQSCVNTELDYSKMTFALEDSVKIKINKLMSLGFILVPGTDRVLMFNPTFDINQSILNAMNKEKIGSTAVYQHINGTDYAHEIYIIAKFYKEYVDQVSAWRLLESFTNQDYRNISNCYANIEAIKCLIEDVLDLNNQSDEGYTKSLYNNVSQFYHKLEYNYTTKSETATLTGPVDTTTNYVEFHNKVRNLITVAEAKSPTGKLWYELMIQARRYCYSIYLKGPVFVNLIRGTKIAFFIYQNNFHETHFFWAKPEDFRNFLGLVLNKDEIQILAQKNSYYPQIYFYDFADFSPENIKGIHYILEFQAQYTRPPSVIYNTLNNKLEIVGGVKRAIVSRPSASMNQLGLNIKLENKPFSNFFDKSKFLSDVKKATLESKPYTHTSQLGLNLKLSDEFSMKKKLV